MTPEQQKAFAAWQAEAEKRGEYCPGREWFPVFQRIDLAFSPIGHERPKA